MNIPIFSNIKYVQENGFLTPEMQIYNDELNQSLQNGLSNNGWTFPPITASKLATVSSIMPSGTVWYETDNNLFVGKVNGVLMKFTMAIYP